MADVPTETQQRPHTAVRAVEVDLPPVDVRRKRPPALAFLLRMETLRTTLRVASLLVLDFAGVFAAIYVALMVKAVLRYGDWAWAASLRRDARHDRLRLPGDRPAVRPLRAVLVARRAPRPVADRLLAVPGDGRRAHLRAGQRRAVLELLHLLRHAGLRDLLHRLAALALRAGHRLHPAASPATAAAPCWSAPASTSRTSRTRSRTRCTRRSRWSASSRSPRGPTTGCARSAGSRTCPRCWTRTACRR